MQTQLKWRDAVDTLCRGEVAEWLNAAVSKTVTSVIPASGVRIPPSPRGASFRGSPASLCGRLTRTRMMPVMDWLRFGLERQG